MERTDLKIEGMSCDHCVAAVRRTLESQEGARVEDVEIGSARVSYDASVTTPDRLAAAITEDGYEATVVAG